MYHYFVMGGGSFCFENIYFCCRFSEKLSWLDDRKYQLFPDEYYYGDKQDGATRSQPRVTSSSRFITLDGQSDTLIRPTKKGISSQLWEFCKNLVLYMIE